MTKHSINPLVAAIHAYASQYNDYQEGIRNYWLQCTCGCVDSCEPGSLRANERCVNNYAPKTKGE